MPLPTTGRITLGDVRNELNKTGPISLGSSEVRNLAGKASGIIKMSDLYGKSNTKIYEMTVGVGPKQLEVGFDVTYGFGTLKPNEFEGQKITSLRASNAILYNNNIVFHFENAEQYKIKKMTVKFDGKSIELNKAETIVGTCVFSSDSNLGMFNFLKQKIGKTISVEIFNIITEK